MIRVELHETKRAYALFAYGHAEYADYGKDVVCAGVSALIFALGQAVEDMADEGLFELEPMIEISPGRAEIVAFSGWKELERIKGAFDTARAGLELIAGDYPGNLSIERKRHAV